MSNFFSWASELPKTSFHDEQLLDLKDKLMSLRAKRRTINFKLEQMMFALRDLEIKCSETMEAEERIEDELERRGL